MRQNTRRAKHQQPALERGGPQVSEEFFCEPKQMAPKTITELTTHPIGQHDIMAPFDNSQMGRSRFWIDPTFGNPRISRSIGPRILKHQPVSAANEQE